MQGVGFLEPLSRIVQVAMIFFLIGWLATHTERPLRETIQIGATTEDGDQSVADDFGGSLPTIAGSAKAVAVGMGVYLAGGILSIVVVFVGTLATGQPIDAEGLLYLSAALAFLLAPALQEKYERQTRSSGWYRGWDRSL